TIVTHDEFARRDQYHQAMIVNLALGFRPGFLHQRIHRFNVAVCPRDHVFELGVALVSDPDRSRSGPQASDRDEAIGMAQTKPGLVNEYVATRWCASNFERESRLGHESQEQAEHQNKRQHRASPYEPGPPGNAR